MIVRETELQGCYIIEPKIFEDDRGYFYERFNLQNFSKQTGRQVSFVQDNQSYSTYGVIRGLHYQIADHQQAKLVSVLQGRVMDIAVDLRKGSDTFGKHLAIELSGDNKMQLFIPRGFAHGFSVLSDTADFFYKCDNYYNKEAEAGIIYNDPTFAIDWKVPTENMIVSEKDLLLPSLNNARL